MRFYGPKGQLRLPHSLKHLIKKRGHKNCQWSYFTPISKVMRFWNENIMEIMAQCWAVWESWYQLCCTRVQLWFCSSWNIYVL